MIFELTTLAVASFTVARIYKPRPKLGQLLAQESKSASQSVLLTQIQTTDASDVSASQPNRHPILHLLKISKTNRKLFIISGLISLAGCVLFLLPIFLFGLLIRTITLGPSIFLLRLGLSGLRSQLLFLGSMFIFASGIDVLVDYLQRKKWLNLSRRVEHQIRTQTLTHVQQLDMAYIENQSSDRLTHLISGDTEQVNQFLEFGMNKLIRATTLILTTGTAFLLLSPLLVCFILLLQPLTLWLARRSQQYVAPHYQALSEKTDRFHHLLANNLGGLSTVRSFTAEDFEVERLTSASETVSQQNVVASGTSSAYASLMRGLFGGGVGASLTLASLLVLSGGMTLGVFLVIIPFIGLLLTQANEFDESYDLYKRTMAAAERIINLLEEPITIRSGQRRLPRGEVRGDITFDQVDFHYHPKIEVLEGFSLHISPQEHVALVGATGCGKTTLAKLLLRFYDVTSGAIRVGGMDIRELCLHDLRASIGLISQDVYLFHGTVYENILYGHRGATFDEVVAAAHLAEAHDFIARLPQGYRTIVGERGQKLSGGQRLAIARAVLKNAPILILDEATSSLDNETEAAIQRALDRIAVNRTTITIAHRLSTIRSADRICVIEGGQVQEEGRHDELLHQDGIYAHLWRMQATDAAVDDRPWVDVSSPSLLNTSDP